MGFVFYQSIGHYISRLVICIDIMDIDFTLGIALSFLMLMEEVEFDCEELALMNNPEKGCYCKVSVPSFKGLKGFE